VYRALDDVLADPGLARSGAADMAVR
jgi:hypothetical protein